MNEREREAMSDGDVERIADAVARNVLKRLAELLANAGAAEVRQDETVVSRAKKPAIRVDPNVKPTPEDYAYAARVARKHSR